MSGLLRLTIMQLIRANAIRFAMEGGARIIPAIRISSDNVRGKMSLT
jgi:hypothetical protein